MGEMGRQGEERDGEGGRGGRGETREGRRERGGERGEGRGRGRVEMGSRVCKTFLIDLNSQIQKGDTRRRRNKGWVLPEDYSALCIHVSESRVIVAIRGSNCKTMIRKTFGERER